MKSPLLSHYSGLSMRLTKGYRLLLLLLVLHLPAKKPQGGRLVPDAEDIILFVHIIQRTKAGSDLKRQFKFPKKGRNQQSYRDMMPMNYNNQYGMIIQGCSSGTQTLVVNNSSLIGLKTQLTRGISCLVLETQPTIHG